MKKIILLSMFALALTSCKITNKLKTDKITNKLTADLHSVKPFFRSLVVYENVYKTKDTVYLKRVYDTKKQMPVEDSTKIYVLRLTKHDPFIRYTIVKDGTPQFIMIPDIYQHPGDTVKNKIKNTITIYPIVNTDSIKGTAADPYYYQIIQPGKDALSPPQQYLATEHITGLPLTIPIKIRFNVPASQSPLILNPSIAYAFGYRIRVNNNPYKENYIRLILVATGLSSDTYLNKDSVNVKGYKGESSIALSNATGVTYETSAWNIGLLLGMDEMFGGKKNWVYQNKPWLGVGLGFKFGDSK